MASENRLEEGVSPRITGQNTLVAISAASARLLNTSFEQLALRLSHRLT